MATSQTYQTGEAAHYKRHSEKEWRKPVIFLGTGSKQVLVKHGGYVRVIPCYIQGLHPKSSFNICQDSNSIKIPLNHATNNSSSVFALHKNPESSPSDCIKVIDDFQKNLQTKAPNQNNSYFTEDLNYFSKTSFSPRTNKSHFETPTNYSCPREFSITPKPAILPKINNRFLFKDPVTGTMPEFTVVSEQSWEGWQQHQKKLV